MINCRRPSNKSSRLNLPLGPSNSYFLSTASQGIRRRSAASASRERVKVFSFTRSCCRAASHSCCDTIGGVFIARRSFECSMSLSLLVAILFLLCSETDRDHSLCKIFSTCRCTPPEFLPSIRLRRALLLYLRCMLGKYALL